MKIELHAEGTLEPLLSFCHNKFTRNNFINAELEILSSVDYDINTVTSYFFVQRFIEQVEANKKMTLISKFLCESTLLYIDFSYFRPSLIGFCCVTVSCLIFQCPERIMKLKGFANNFSWNEVKRCFVKLINAGRKCSSNPKNAVFHKFTHLKIKNEPNMFIDLIKNINLEQQLIESIALLFGHRI